MIEAMEQRSNCFSPMRLLTFEVLYSLKACPDRECSMSSIPLQRTKGKTCRLRCCSRPMIPKMDDASCKAAFVALLDCSRVPESHRRQPRHVHVFILQSSSTFEGPPHRMTQTYSNMMGLSQSRIFLGPRTASHCPTAITLTETTVLPLPHEVQPWPTAVTLTETTVHAT